jgi:hypothetical protein
LAEWAVYGQFVKKKFRATNNAKYYTVFKSPGTNNSGAFYWEKEMDVKETKFVLGSEERAALLEAKYERARAQAEAMIAQIEAMKKIIGHPSKD